ncbi:uncharacterized protein LOC141851266 [Brevipalpus obovatus]|uniref:uncharacterized protein LOC141851266 n=1 Tax=Brevipalpus obovatus TaxID=246614 RepID=UPI003D9F80E9
MWLKMINLNHIFIIITLFMHFNSMVTNADEAHEKLDQGNQAEKNPVPVEIVDDDDLIKAESQDVAEHKAYQGIHQGQFETAIPGNGHPMNFPHQMSPSAPEMSIHMGQVPVDRRPGYIHHPSSKTAPAHSHGPPPPNYHGPIVPPPGVASQQPVYSNHPHGPPPSGSVNPHDNQIEYGPEPNSGHGYVPGYESNNAAQSPAHHPPAPTGSHSTEVAQQNENWPLPAPEMPKISHLDVKCEKNLMKVAIEFDKPFNGIIFSKGHYSHSTCVHLAPNSGRTSVYFDVSIGGCGTTGNTQNGLYGYGAQSGSGTFFENTIVIQYDPQVQEVWDQARKLRCTWHDQYEKSVTFRPFPVDMLDVVRADFAGDNVGCWMQIQVGKGPWASEVAGIVKIGQTMTMVLAIKDEENKFDMLVRNCIAHDGKRAPIELVDSQGCIVRPKLMSRFTKIKNFGSSATVLSYAHFQAFKFPDSMEVHFQCTIQICRFQCPEQCTGGVSGSSSGSAVVSGPGSIEPVVSPQQQESYAAASSYHAIGKPREERDVSAAMERLVSEYNVDSQNAEVGVNKIIRVVSTGDFAFSVQNNDTDDLPVLDIQDIGGGRTDIICMSTISFASSVIVLIVILVISCLLSVFLCLHQRTAEKGKLAELGLSYEFRNYPVTKSTGKSSVTGSMNNGR